MSAGDNRPNVVVFLADDLGWGDLGCYGSTAIPTPVLDRLASEGALYTDCHAASAVCTPSRYSLLTGEYPWRSPLQEGVLGGTDPSILRDEQPTLASILKAEGYRTGAFGKWHLGLGWTRTDGTRPSAFEGPFHSDMQASGRDVDYTVPFTDGPTAHGFDRFFGIAGSLDMPPYCYLDQDHTVGVPSREKHPLVTSQRPGLQVDNWDDQRVDLDITRVACDWIREQATADRPFFAYIASAAPHRPCVPPEFVQGMSDAGARGDAVCLVDWMIGQVRAVLAETGTAENTLVVFTSDNGAPMIFPEDGDVEVHRPNGPWRGQKADAWEGGHRVPLIVAGPGVRPCTVHDPVSLLDVLPTMAQLVGAGGSMKAAHVRDGVVLAGFAPTRDRVIGQQSFDGALVLREGQDKAILSNGTGGFSEPVGRPVAVTADDAQFYDLAQDPGERDNLWASRRSDASAMLARFVADTGYSGKAVAHA